MVLEHACAQCFQVEKSLENTHIFCSKNVILSKLDNLPDVILTLLRHRGDHFIMT